MATVKIEVLKDGPYIVEGDIVILDAEGKPIEPKGKAGKVALCRCGRSSEKPFCDGTHRQTCWKETENS